MSNIDISDDISQDSVANVTNEICGVFNKAARKTFGLIHHKTLPISNESKKKHGLMEIVEQQEGNFIWLNAFIIDVTQQKVKTILKY